MNNLYYKSPVFVQHILTSIFGTKLWLERYNKSYKIAFKNYITKKNNKENLFLELLYHLKSNVPFYNNITINENKLVETLKNLPYTEKENLRNELEERSTITERNLAIKTGGTTGKSLMVYSSKKDMASRMAYLDYIKFQNGVIPFSRRASFTGKEITPEKHKNILWRYNLPMRQMLYASFKINASNVEYVFNNLSKYKPVSIDGFPTSISLLAKYILSNNIAIDWDIKAVFPTAENLTPEMKKDIEKAFNTKVINQYASSEGSPFIYSDADNNYHLGEETGIFEFYKIQKNLYEMVVTSLINYATPIIRYKIGDYVEIDSNEDYLCSLVDTIKIINIMGRSTDHLVGLDNNLVTSVHLSNSVKELGDKVIQSQFIQKDRKNVYINLVVAPIFNFSKDEEKLSNKLKHRLGENMRLHFNYLAEIPKEKSGKTRFIVNYMEEING